MLQFFDRLNHTVAYKQLLSDVRGKKFTAAFGVQQNEKPFIAANCDDFVLYVTTDYVEAQKITRTLNVLKGGFAFLPYKDDVLLFKQSAVSEAIVRRNVVLDQVLCGRLNGLVVCAESLAEVLPPKSLFLRGFSLEKGNETEYATLAQKLVDCGYRRVQTVTAVGEFTIHGDIVEVFTHEGKMRFEFFGNEVDAVREVGDDGKSTGERDSFYFIPLSETVGADATTLEKVVRYAERQKISPDAMSKLRQIAEKLSVEAAGGRADNGWLTPFLPQATLAEYLPPNAAVVFDEPRLLADRIRFLYDEQENRIVHLVSAGEILPLHTQTFTPQSKVFAAFDGNRQLALQTAAYGGTFFRPQVVHRFSSGGSPNYVQTSENFLSDVTNWQRNGYEIVVLAGNVMPLKETQAHFRDVGVYFSVDEVFKEGSAQGLLTDIAVERGFISHTNKLVVLGTRDIGRSMSPVKQSKSKKQAFLSVEKGDYVVHDIHGIGMCEGTEKIDNGSGSKDYFVVLYKGGDRLYVPVENSNMLSRYSGEENPVLSRIGGEDFNRVKEKVKNSIRQMSVNLLQLYAEREKPRGHTYHIDPYLAEEFARAFPYEETADQIRCIEEINADLSSKRIMDRVLVGDVGYGKTEVAMRAAFNVVASGYQVAVLVPTTILAQQHYETFSARMQPFDVRVACLNRFRSPKEQKEILEKTAKGEVDILIGTHRLLSKDVAFPRLGLLILDEEQRFGVEHKEHIKNLKRKVDVLMLSATPIPRTLHMALSGIRDISTITTPPVERQAVATFVAEAGQALLYDVIMREIGRGGQVFLLYNRVESIDFFAARVAELVPKARITVAHGQMPENILEDNIFRFQQGKTDVLICTTIIENGIDIPNANTLIVYDADCLGLSQLYQLRGRVGRSNRLAYAYFTYREGKILSETAFKRLYSITEYSELGSGFKIAMKDLEIRGAGNVLGREQHGHMMKVGYDMYARLLKQTVSELKGEKTAPDRDTETDIDADAYAPDDFIGSASERMDFYRELASAADEKALSDLRDKISQIYGTPPRQVANLFLIAEMKLLAKGADVGKITVKNNAASLQFDTREQMMRPEVVDAVSRQNGRVSFAADGYKVVFRADDFLQKERLLAAVKDFLLKTQVKR